MRIRFLTSLIAAGSVIALTACGIGGDPSSESAQSSPPQAESPIPPVKNPRDVATLARQPCELLTLQQAAGFGLDSPPEQYDAALGDLGCKWTTTTPERQTFRTVRIDTFINNPTLEVAYSKRRGLPFFELTEISGYPALVSRTNADLAICDIEVKPAERQSVSVTYESKEFNNDPQQACVVGKQVAAAVLMNLPLKS